MRAISGLPAVAAGSKRVSRRTLLAGVAGGVIAGAARAQGVTAGPLVLPSQAPKLDDTVAAGFNRSVIARWGDAVLPNAPPFNPDPLTADEADTQFPYDAVIAGVVAPPPAQDGIPRLVMVLANPSAPARMVFPGGLDNPAVAGKLQGATVLNLQYLSGRWLTVDGGYQSRRLADGTLCEISGPVAAQIGATVQGLLAPAAGCIAPWGAALLAEGDTAPWATRLQGVGYGYGDPANAVRFGWITDFDPLEPASFPTKRTALGRLARAGIAATTTHDGRLAVFFTQDDPAGCLFRFISTGPASDGAALDDGSLSVAQIIEGDVTWLPLGNDIPTLAGLAGAARAAGGSPFDAPGGIAIAPGNAALYLACAGNPERMPGDTNPLNPRANDDNGHIVVLTPPQADITAKTFAGNLAIAAGNPNTAPFTQYTPGSNAWLTRPRTLNLDAQGSLWIGTDQRGALSATADGLFIMQTAGPSPFLLSAAYFAPIGAAMGGAAFDPATRTVFSPVRHPGATPQATFDNPATRWPTLAPGMPPQTTVIGLIRTS